MTKQHKLPTRAEGIERLRTLYAVLAGIPNRHTDLGTWFFAKRREPVVPTIDAIVNECGSTACALGWAALYPEFNKLGLAADIHRHPVFMEEEGFYAAKMFFCLTEIEAQTLFGGRRAGLTDGTALREACYEGLDEFEWGDKRIALHRIRRFLELTDAITPERSAELAEIEKGY